MVKDMRTKRALQREGITIAEQASVKIKIRDRAGQTACLLHFKTHANEFDSIY
ncbi:MAG: hypothetical protein KDD15_27785 [Lewinella sp.]|nr:hypothetical protein [Lewinella sp.]